MTLIKADYKKFTVDVIKPIIKHEALYRLNRYAMRANELCLNQFFIKKYKKTLKQICTEIICGVSIKYDGEDVIVTTAREHDDVAAFITYGNLQYRGSDILKYAFS